jgi:hypothetical protein
MPAAMDLDSATEARFCFLNRTPDGELENYLRDEPSHLSPFQAGMSCEKRDGKLKRTQQCIGQKLFFSYPWPLYPRYQQ